LVSHRVATAFEMGWEQLENGKLLAETEKTFDAFITTNKTFVTNKILPSDDWRYWFCPRRAGRKSKSTWFLFPML
jgi:hypothetical protein